MAHARSMLLVPYRPLAMALQGAKHEAAHLVLLAYDGGTTRASSLSRRVARWMSVSRVYKGGPGSVLVTLFTTPCYRTNGRQRSPGRDLEIFRKRSRRTPRAAVRSSCPTAPRASSMNRSCRIASDCGVTYFPS